MARKTRSTDLEARARLRKKQQRQKQKNRAESFSETVRRIAPEPVDLDRWLEAMGRNPLGSEAAEAIEKRIRSRDRASRRAR